MIFDLKRTVAFTRGASTVGREDHFQALEGEVICLFDQLRDALIRYLSSFGLSMPDSEEVVQDAFLSLFRHLQAGKPRENLPAWLFRVAHNLALKSRQQGRRDIDMRVNLATVDFVVDPEPNPEDQVANEQRRTHLLTVIAALPDQDRRCLFLRAEGLRYRGIPEVLDISLGAVSLSLERTLDRIARATRRYKL